MNDPFEHEQDGPPPGPLNQLPPQQPGMRCHHCHQDLAGTMLGGACPHCGAPITANFYSSRQSAGMATASMVLGIIAVIGAPGGFCCGCLTGVGLICGILAVVFYFPAMNAIKNETAPPNSKGMALTGLICGILGLLISLSYVVFFIIVIIMNP